MGNTILFKISEIAERLNKNMLKIPPVQRGKVWNAVRVEVLWDSLLRGIPIGYLSVLSVSEDKYDLLDGQQRCNAISMGYSDFNIESKAILWIDLGMNSAETEQDDNKIKHSNRRFFFRVSTQAHPWGYKLSDNETSNKTLNAYEKRAAVEKINERWDNSKQRPSPYELWPVDAKFPVPFTLLRQFCEQKQDQGKTLDDFLHFCKKNQKHNWNWLEHIENKLSKKDKDSQNIYKQAQHIFGELHTTIDKLNKTTIVAQNVSGISDEDVGLYFKRMNKAGVEPGNEEIRYSLLKSRLPELKLLDDLSENRMQPARLADIAMKTYFIVKQEKWKNNITNSDLNFLTSTDNRGSWLEYIKSEFKKYIKNVENWLVYNKETNKFGLPRFVYSSIARSNTQDIYSLLIFFAATGYKFENEIDRKNLIALITLICWFGTGKNRSTIISKGYDIYKLEKGDWLTATRQWLFDSIKENLLLLPPKAEIYERIRTATSNKNWDELQKAWNPLGYREALDATWHWQKKESRELLLYACREYLNTKFPEYDPADAVWCEENRPWDYDHIFPQSWLISGRGKKQGQYHELAETFLNSIGNIAPLPFSMNRAKNDDAPREYQKNDNSLLFVDVPLHKDFFNEGNKFELEQKLDKAYLFANITAIRLLKLYSKWYDDLTLDSLLDFSYVKDERRTLYEKVNHKDVEYFYVVENNQQQKKTCNADWARQWLAVGYETEYGGKKCLCCIASDGKQWEVGYRRHPDAMEIDGDSNKWWFECSVCDKPEEAENTFNGFMQQGETKQ